jgi:AraC-like DNA-binding protein
MADCFSVLLPNPHSQILRKIFSISRKMSAHTISSFGESDELCAALTEAGYRRLLVIQPGAFRARMTRITLDHVRLTFVEEQLARIATITSAPGTTRVLLPPIRGRLLFGGLMSESGRIMTHGAGQSVIERLDGPCWWRDIVIPTRHLTAFSRALTGTAIVAPPAVRLWQPTARALKALSALHAAATRVTETHPGKQYSQQASHGLEQELIDRAVECLSGGPIGGYEVRGDRCAGIMARFGQSIDAYPDQLPSIGHFCQELNVDERALRRCCRTHLGLGPVRYLRLLRMQRVRRALQNRTCGTTTVTQVVHRHGFCEVGRFATEYRALYGELPSETLRQGTDDPLLWGQYKIFPNAIDPDQ